MREGRRRSRCVHQRASLVRPLEQTALQVHRPTLHRRALALKQETPSRKRRHSLGQALLDCVTWVPVSHFSGSARSLAGCAEMSILRLMLAPIHSGNGENKTE